MRSTGIALTCAAAGALVLVAAGCTNVSDITVTRGGGDEGIRDAIPPATAYMFNEAMNALELPTGAVGAGEYVAVYHLSAGTPDDQWWTYLAEDALVSKISAAGATPVERNDAAAALLATEAKYVPPPKTAKGAVDVMGPAGKEPRAVTPYRATRVLCYRVVTAKLWLEPPQREANRVAVHKTREAEGRGPAALVAMATSEEVPSRTVHATAQVIVNLRTLDAQTGEVLWTGTVTATAARDVPVTWLEPYDFWNNAGWDDHDWDNNGPWDWCFRWSEEPAEEEVYIGPAH